MKRIRRTFAIVLALLMVVFAFAACGSQGSTDNGSETSEPVSIDSIKTIGDAFALEAEDNQSAVYEGRVVYAFKYDDTYYRVRANISEEDQQAYFDIEFDDEDYEAKQHEIIDPLEITLVENLSDQILSQDELDALAGKTGKELVEEGWNYQGSYFLDDMEVWMDYGPFDYSIKFDGSIAENSDDLDIEKETGDMKVVSAEFSMLGDATDISLDPEEAEYQIQSAMQYQLEETYGDKVTDARIYVEKVYTAEEVQEDEVLSTYGLGPDEAAFEVRYELHPAEGTDVNELLAATGEYDEESGWVTEKYNVGILRPTEDGSYTITDFGTGW